MTVAIVTGAASGIGGATATTLTEAGASVVLADVNVEGAEKAVADLEVAGCRAAACPVGIGDEDSVRTMAAECLRRFGRIDVLVNNAARNMPVRLAAGEVDDDVTSMDMGAWDRGLRATLSGTALCCKHCLPPMLAQGSGAIVNVTSIACLNGDTKMAAYSSAKAGVISLTRHVATTYGPRGIRCNAVAPGVIVTSPDPAIRRIYEESARFVPIGREGTVEDVARVIAFLASDLAAYVTGQVLAVDSGLTSYLPYARTVDADG